MTRLPHTMTDRDQPVPGARRPRGGAVAAALSLLLVAGFAGGAAAQKSYRYEDDPVRAGNKALEEMRLDEAKIKFEEAVSSGYQIPKAKYGLAEVMMRTGRTEEAEALYREALDTAARSGEKSFAEANAGLGILLIETERWDEGAPLITTARKQNGGYWPAMYGEARILIREKKLDKAKAQLDYGAGRKGVAQGEDLYHRGMAMYFLASNDLKDAETSALSAFHLNPSDPRHGKLVAYVYEKRNVPALAINACEEVMRTPGFTPTASFMHYTGTLYQKAERFNEARDRYVKAVEIDSTYAPVLKDLAGLLRLAKQYDRASAVYLRYVTLEPNDIEGKVGLAETLNEAGRYRQALEVANQAMETDSTRWDVRLAYARSGIRSRDKAVQERAAYIYASMPDSVELKAPDLTLIAAQQMENKHLDEAKANLDKAIAQDPDYADAYFQKGMLAFKTNQPDSAVVHFEAAIRRDPKSPLYFMNLGLAQMQLRQFDKSIPAFRSAIALDQNLVIGHVMLGQALASADSIPAAKASYERALKIDPTNARALRGMGFIHLRNQDFEAAAGSYKAATAAEPRNADGWAGLGQAYLGMSNLPEAESAFRKAQSIDPNNATMKRGMELLNKARGG